MSPDSLVKGCRKEHALESTDTLLLSVVHRFREEGERLIRDAGEGRAEKTLGEETEKDGWRRTRRVAEVVEYGEDWWIFSTSRRPETANEWKAWRETLDPAYDHVSPISRPARLAEAIGRMIVDQIGPQGRDQGKFYQVGEGRRIHAVHPTQIVMHGPVVYRDDVLELIDKAPNSRTKIARGIFLKQKTHTAQREYRYAVLSKKKIGEKKLFLKTTGLLRDSLGAEAAQLIRPTGQEVEREERGPNTGREWNRTTNEETRQYRERRWSLRDSEGRAIAGAGERVEENQERVGC